MKIEFQLNGTPFKSFDCKRGLSFNKAIEYTKKTLYTMRQSNPNDHFLGRVVGKEKKSNWF